MVIAKWKIHRFDLKCCFAVFFPGRTTASISFSSLLLFLYLVFYSYLSLFLSLASYVLRETEKESHCRVYSIEVVKVEALSQKPSNLIVFPYNHFNGNKYPCGIFEDDIR